MTKKTAQERGAIFLEKAKEVHGDKYDYSKVKYNKLKDKVIITCKEHGDFLQAPEVHIICGCGCPKCGITKKVNALLSNTKKFIEKAKKLHGDKYDYSKVEYKNANTNIVITCKIHGDFAQKPNNHLHKGCNKCSKTIYKNIKIRDTNQFIQRVKEIHGDKYDYSKVDYKNTKTKVIIICKEHGEFEQTPNSHLNGAGCMECSKNRKTKEDFLEKAKEIHGDRYDYSKVEYKRVKEKIIIICKEHGEFEQTPQSHLLEHGCIECGINNLSSRKRSNKEEFIERAKEIHGDRYDYSKVEYKKAIQKVIIICKDHGEFMLRPNRHLHERQGCQKCQAIGYSKKQIIWLDFLSKFYNINIQHAVNGTEYNIPNTKYKADGFCKETNTIFEFHGDYWHGNPKLFNSNDYNKKTKCTFGELYEKTLKKEQYLKESGFNLITIWEFDWNKLNRCVSILQKKIRTKF